MLPYMLLVSHAFQFLRLLRRVAGLGLRFPRLRPLTPLTALAPLSPLARLPLLFPLIALWPAMSVMAAVGPTVREVIEFTRLIQPVKHDEETLQSQISADGDRAFIVTRTAHVASDTNKVDILMLDVNPARLAASRQAAPTRLLTVTGRADEGDDKPSLRDARWVGNRTIAFRARMNDGPYQVYRIDVVTKQLTQMTDVPLGVLDFDLTTDLRRVVYVAPVPNPAVPPGSHSVVVGNQSFWSIHGQPDDLSSQQRRYQFFVAESGIGSTSRPLGEAFPQNIGGFPSPSISPDGRWLVLPKYEPSLQLAWGKQYPPIAEVAAKFGPSTSMDPLGYFSRPMGYVPRRHVAYRLSDGLARVVIDAPDDSRGGNQQRNDRLWMDDGASLVIAGTYLPQRIGGADSTEAIGATDAGVAGDDGASHIIEYWPDSGRWKSIAVLKARLTAAHRVPGAVGTFVAVDGEQRRRFERASDGAWREVAGQGVAEGPSDKPRSAWRLLVRQALDQPPDIVAVGPSGASVPLTHLNPQYSASWGTMRAYNWKDAKGRDWHGGLMVPADFKPGAKHALVIQTYGFDPTRFYRDGTNIYDGSTSGFPGRAFLRENILVLALPFRPITGAAMSDRESLVAFSEGVRGAIDALVGEGLVDRERIGIIGWSASGERAMNLVTFTDTPIRAASLVDGDSNTLYSMTITYGFLDSTQVRKETVNQGPPFGESLARWIENDPALHTDCIRSALRIESYGSYVKNNWDIYALLRRQYRPVEMIKFPKGGHALAGPIERMISLQGNVDWYRFWLKGEKRSEVVIPTETEESLKAQYVRWDQMVPMKAAVDSKPQCARLGSGEWAGLQKSGKQR